MPEAARSAEESPGLHLAVALDGAGWHPAAWRRGNGRQGNGDGPPEASRPDLFTAGYWAGLAREAEAGHLDFLTIEDSLGPRPWGGVRPGAEGASTGEPRAGDIAGRLDAVLLAARIAPLTSGIGIIPAAVATHTEPFHVSTAIATLDYVSEGRAGWRPRVSAAPAEAAHFGRREFPQVTPGTAEAERLTADLFEEAADHVEVVRRLWDSWEDDAVIRDVATGRFIDREKLHYIDFEGRWFSVRGPSITPRPPQGQPVVAALAHAGPAYRFAARAADVVFVTPRDPAHATKIKTEIKSARPIRSLAIGRASGGSGGSSPRAGTASERTQPPAKVYADLTVFLDDQPGAAAARRAALDETAGREYVSDSVIVASTPGELADLLLAWRAAGLDGFRLRPGVLPHDLERITRGLVPELRRRGVFRTSYTETTLRERLGLSPRPVNRYAAEVA